jgi:hypothetical protein
MHIQPPVRLILPSCLNVLFDTVAGHVEYTLYTPLIYPHRIYVDPGIRGVLAKF